MKTYKTNIKKFKIIGQTTDFPKNKIENSNDCYEVIRKFYHEDIEVYESFFILLLNRANNTIGYAKISQGGIVGTVIDTKLIAKYCIDSLASSVILAHNHPSGNLGVSSADKEITIKIKNTLAIFDCKVLDHLIITENKYTSFADEGIL